MEGVHQQVSQFRPLYHFSAADEVCSAPNCDPPSLIVLALFARGNKFAEIGEFRGAICVSEQHVLAAGVAHAVGDSAALSAVLGERDHPD